MGASAVKAVPKKDTRTKVPTKKKAKVVKQERYFAFDDHVDIKDLSKKPLRIKQLVQFIPQDDDDNPLDSADVTIEIYEMKAGGDERANSLMLRIKGKVTKAEGYNFVVDEISQDEKVLLQAKKPKSAGGDELFVTARLEVVGVDDKVRGKTGLEFALAPMEYDETLELQMGSTIKGTVIAQAKVTFSTFDLMLAEQKRTPLDETSGVPHGEAHQGNVHHVVVHCMCAVNVVDDPKDSFDVQKNLGVFRASSGPESLSAHYIIDRNGTITQAVDVHNIAHHAFSKKNTTKHRLFAGNKQSIGIELLGFADGFRQDNEKRFEQLQKAFDDKKAKLEKDKKDLEDLLKKRQKEQADGKQKVKVGKGEMEVAKAIALVEAAISQQDARIEALKLDPWAEKWQSFTSDKDADGVPKVFKYTDEQYQALGDLLQVVGKRYGYELVCSHHYICPSRKTDPGIYFDWSKLTPHLLPGKLEGDETAGGGLFLVS